MSIQRELSETLELIELDYGIAGWHGDDGVTPMTYTLYHNDEIGRLDYMESPISDAERLEYDATGPIARLVSECDRDCLTSGTGTLPRQLGHASLVARSGYRNGDVDRR